MSNNNLTPDERARLQAQILSATINNNVIPTMINGSNINPTHEAGGSHDILIEFANSNNKTSNSTIRLGGNTDFNHRFELMLEKNKL